VEFDLKAGLGNGLGVIPSSLYGAVFSILPHSY